MPAAEDQHPVQYLSAQGADEAFAGRVHARCLDSGTQDPGTGGLEHGVERGGEVRSAVADEELDVLELLAEGEGEVAGLLHRSLAGGVGGDSAKMHPAGAMFDGYQDVQSSQQHCVHVQEVDHDDLGGLGVQELPPGRARAAPGRCRRPAGSPRRWTARLSRRVSPVSPWIRRCPHSEFSFTRRTMSRAMPGTVGGRPGLRRLLVPYFLAVSLRCQARSVAGVTGKTSAQRLRGMSRASAASQTRSAGS
jgi:hypothetical protein